MMNKTLIIAALGGSALLAGYLVSSRAEVDDSDAAARRTTDQTKTTESNFSEAKLTAQVAALQRQMRVLQREQKADAAEAPHEQTSVDTQATEQQNEASEELAPQQELSTEERRARREARAQVVAKAQSRALEAALEQEARDYSWSTQQEDAIRTALTTDFAGYQIEELDCRTNLCRLVVTHDEATSQELGRVFQSPAMTGGGRYETNADGTRTTFYAYREGSREYRKQLLASATADALSAFAQQQ